jgi:SAM-dependent methyltransferase
MFSFHENVSLTLRESPRARHGMPEDQFHVAFRPVRAARVDPSVPNEARMWNSLAGGRDNFESDRRAARQLAAVAPVMTQLGAASRAFLRRAVTYLAAEGGIRQFLDIGTGMPAEDSTHSVAEAADPSCRVVYVDIDPVVLSHARAQLRSPADGATSYLEADAGDTTAILDGARQTLDLTRPVGVLMIMVLQLVEDAADALARLVAALPSGSHLAVLHPVRDERLLLAARRWNHLGSMPVFLRDRDEIARWFAGLELAEPGLVEAPLWRPAAGDRKYPEGIPLLGAVARMP